jgi:hypothetical protein
MQTLQSFCLLIPGPVNSSFRRAASLGAVLRVCAASERIYYYLQHKSFINQFLRDDGKHSKTSGIHERGAIARLCLLCSEFADQN